MLLLKQIIKTLLYVSLGTILLVSTGHAESKSLAGNSELELMDTILVNGKVWAIEFDTKTVIIKPKKGKKIRIIYGDQTELRGFFSLEEFEKRQRIKIWYFKDGEKNMAVKIQMIPELGC